MAEMFSCDEDQANLADFCCSCTYPLPCICAQCRDTHLSKPNSHHFLPLSAKAAITSAKDLTRVQLRLHRLDLTYNELWRVLGTFQKAREDIEATYLEMVHLLTREKEKHLDQLKIAAQGYQSRIKEAMQENYSNSWKEREFMPADPLTAMIWTHEPGEDTDFDLHYQIDKEKEQTTDYCRVSWVLPFPGLSCFPQNTITIKLLLDSGAVEYILVNQYSTIKEIKFLVSKRMKLLPKRFNFMADSRILPEDSRLNINSTLYLTSKITINVTTAFRNVISFATDLNYTVNDLLTSISKEDPSATKVLYRGKWLSKDDELFPKKSYMLYQGKWLDRMRTLADCGIFDGAAVQVALRKILDEEGNAAYERMPQLAYRSHEDMTIRVEDHFVKSECYFSLSVNSSDTIRVIKDLIWEKKSYEVIRQQLRFGGKALNDSLTLGDCNIKNKSFILLFPLLEREMEINVLTSKGKIIILDVESSDTIEAVKTKLWNKEDIPPDQQLLICNGEVLEDIYTLDFYHIKEDFNINLVLRIGGEVI